MNKSKPLLEFEEKEDSRNLLWLDHSIKSGFQQETEGTVNSRSFERGLIKKIFTKVWARCGEITKDRAVTQSSLHPMPTGMRGGSSDQNLGRGIRVESHLERSCDLLWRRSQRGPGERATEISTVTSLSSLPPVYCQASDGLLPAGILRSRKPIDMVHADQPPEHRAVWSRVESRSQGASKS